MGKYSKYANYECQTWDDLNSKIKKGWRKGEKEENQTAWVWDCNLVCYLLDKSKRWTCPYVFFNILFFNKGGKVVKGQKRKKEKLRRGKQPKSP